MRLKAKKLSMHICANGWNPPYMDMSSRRCIKFSMGTWKFLFHFVTFTQKVKLSAEAPYCFSWLVSALLLTWYANMLISHPHKWTFAISKWECDNFEDILKMLRLRHFVRTWIALPRSDYSYVRCYSSFSSSFVVLQPLIKLTAADRNDR